MTYFLSKSLYLLVIYKIIYRYYLPSCTASISYNASCVFVHKNMESLNAFCIVQNYLTVWQILNSSTTYILLLQVQRHRLQLRSQPFPKCGLHLLRMPNLQISDCNHCDIRRRVLIGKRDRKRSLINTNTDSGDCVALLFVFDQGQKQSVMFSDG